MIFSCNLASSVKTNILLAFVSLLASCSFLDGMLTTPQEEVPAEPQSATQPEVPPQSVEIEDLAVSRARTLSDIELLWEIPEEEVEGYVISYGQSENDLTKQVRLLSTSLEKVEDSRHGFVYRYVLSGLPLSQTVFIAIAAYKGESVSPPSRIIKVDGQ